MLYKMYTEVCYAHYRVNYGLISSPTLQNTGLDNLQELPRPRTEIQKSSKDNTFLKIRQKVCKYLHFEFHALAQYIFSRCYISPIDVGHDPSEFTCHTSHCI